MLYKSFEVHFWNSQQTIIDYLFNYIGIFLQDYIVYQGQFDVLIFK